MSQLSLFSADLTPPQLVDLGGLLAAHGQIVWDAGGAALVIVLADRWRAEALMRECRVRDVTVRDVTVRTLPSEPADDLVAPPPARADDAQGDAVRGGVGTVVLRTEATPEFTAFVADWIDEDGKAVPAGMPITPGFLRCWVIAAGQPTPLGTVLGLDPLAPATHEPLAAACAAAGLAGSLLGPRGGGPAVRIVGHRRCMRLVEMIGSPPPEAPLGAFPVGRH